MDKKEIFISYSSAQASTAFQVRDLLESHGNSCWIAPDCILSGSDYSHEIPKAIKNCSVFLVVLSRKSQASKWVKRELASAIQLGKKIIPFMTEDFALNKEFNFYLSNVQRYNAYIGTSEMLLNMINEINLILGKEKINPPEDNFDSFICNLKNDSIEDKILNNIINTIKAVTPYGREEAKNPVTKTCLNMVSALTAIFFLPFILISLSDENGLVSLIGFMGGAYLTWNLSFLFCIRIGNLKKKNFFLSALGAISGFFISLAVVFAIAILILKNYVW